MADGSTRVINLMKGKEVSGEELSQALDLDLVGNLMINPHHEYTEEQRKADFPGFQLFQCMLSTSLFDLNPDTLDEFCQRLFIRHETGGCPISLPEGEGDEALEVLMDKVWNRLRLWMDKGWTMQATKDSMEMEAFLDRVATAIANRVALDVMTTCEGAGAAFTKRVKEQRKK